MDESADSRVSQYFGELEYIFGSFKLTFITMLIVMMLILDTMNRGSPQGFLKVWH
jgi:amino acid permease